MAVSGIAMTLSLAGITSADPDLWGHVRFGLDLLHTHRLTSVDPYSFTQDRPWVNHEWLSELQMAAVYRVGGVLGLTLLKGALVGMVVVFAWIALGGVELPVRLATVGLWIVGTATVIKTMRPQLWSLLFFAALCHALATRPGWRKWLPLLFIFWANVHGGWLLGLATLAAWAIVSVAIDLRSIRVWLWIVFGSAGATLINPYGPGLWKFMLQTVGMTRPVTEWQPLWTLSVAAWIPWVAAVFAAIWTLRSKDPARAPRTAVLAMLAYMSFRVQRVEAFFVTAALFLLAPSIRNAWPARHSITPKEERWAAWALSVGAALCVVSALTVFLRCIRVEGPWSPDSDAAVALRNAQPGRLVTAFAWGEYAIWHVGPQLRVSMDGRRETVYSDRRLGENGAIVDGASEGPDVLRQWQPEYVWLPQSSSVARQWLASNGYRIDRSTSRSFIAVRKDLPTLGGGVEQPKSECHCFPD